MNNNYLQVYGNTEDIKALSERIQRFATGSQKLSPADALSLAQISVAHGLNPFNGEVWFIPNRGAMVGIKGLRATARRQSLFHVEFKRLDADEAKEMNIQAGDVARRCEIYRLDLWQAMGKAARPIVGYGVCRKNEATKMEHLTAAMKRAEADAIKRAYDVPFAVSEFDSAIPENGATLTIEEEGAIEGQATESAQSDAEDLFGEDEQAGQAETKEPKIEDDLPDVTIAQAMSATQLLKIVNGVLPESLQYESVYKMQTVVKSWPKPNDTPAWYDAYRDLYLHAMKV